MVIRKGTIYIRKYGKWTESLNIEVWSEDT